MAGCPHEMVSKKISTRIAELRKAAYVSQGGVCFYCDRRMWLHSADRYDPGSATADHITPLSQGGDMFGLIVAACRECNSRRGNMPWLFFVALMNEERKRDADT